jgi:hypothetical protein
MEDKPEVEAQAEAERKAKAKRDLLLGIFFAALIIGLITVIAMIEEYGQSHMPGAANGQVRDAPDS